MPPEAASPAVVILAGRRAGAADPIAQGAGVSHKCIAPVAGAPMILHVIRTAMNALPGARVVVSIDDAAVFGHIPEIAAGLRSGRLVVSAAQVNIVDSIVAAVGSASGPVIVTTADNVLLSAEALRRVADFGPASGADAVVALSRRESVLAAHGEGQRRFYTFRDGAFSNCNLYWLADAHALKAAEAFRGGGQFDKHPARIVAAFGIINLIRFRFRMNSVEVLFRSIGERFGLRILPLVLADGRQSIDVDNAGTLRVTEELLAREAA